jgi:periplasmic divalent cation tolerance protein
MPRRENYYYVGPMNRAEAKNKRIVLVTCPSVAVARKIAHGVVQKRLAACVNVILSPVESVYTWKGEVERAREYLLVMKTTAKRLAELEREVARLHSYDVPEFIALRITEGSRKYFSWMDESVAERRKNRK